MYCTFSYMFQPLSVETLVLLRNSHQDGRKGGKLRKQWYGPYKTVELLGNKIFNQKTRKVVKKAINICRLKLFYSGEQKKSLIFQIIQFFKHVPHPSLETSVHMNYPMFPIKIQFHRDQARPSKEP